MPDLRSEHYLDVYGKGGRCDSCWTARLKDPEKWVAISKDGGRRSHRGMPRKPKLPEICHAIGLRLVVLTPHLIDSGWKTYQAALHRMFENMDLIYRLPPGVVIKLGMVHRKKGQIDYDLRIGGVLIGTHLERGEKNGKAR